MIEEKDDQIEGTSGRSDNVKGTKDDESDDIVAHDFGRGINTEVTMQRLASNRAVYARDMGAEEFYGQMKEPDQYAEKVTTPDFIKKPDKD